MEYIISDIHGNYYSLLDLLEKIRAQDKSPKLIFLGDYVDRGPFSKETVELLIQLQNEGAVCLRGNHDDVIDWLLNQHSISDISEVCRALDDFSVANWWIQNGFMPTLKNYNAVSEFGLEATVEQFRKQVPESHKQFIRNLPLYWGNDTHFVCHASFSPYKENPRDIRFFKNEYKNDTLWTRFSRDIRSVKTKWDKIGVFGHTPTWYHEEQGQEPKPIFHDKIRLIDLGCFCGGKLAAYCVQKDAVIDVPQNEQDRIIL